MIVQVLGPGAVHVKAYAGVIAPDTDVAIATAKPNSHFYWVPQSVRRQTVDRFPFLPVMGEPSRAVVGP